jgi:hypothetical protein
MKGAHLAPPGTTWADMWDVEFDAQVLAGAGAADEAAV